MNESNLKDNFKIAYEHLKNRRLCFDIFNLPLKKTVFKVFNITSKSLKRKFEEILKTIEKRRKNCPLCLHPIDTCNPFILYTLDVTSMICNIIKIEVCCSKCYMIKNFTLFSKEFYQNVNSKDFIFLGLLYEHYYQVNKLSFDVKWILQNDINNYLSCSLLLKNLPWNLATPHPTFDAFLKHSLEERNSFEEVVNNNNIHMKKRKFNNPTKESFQKKKKKDIQS